MNNNGIHVSELADPTDSFFRRAHNRVLAFEDKHPVIFTAIAAVAVTAAFAPAVKYAGNRIEEAIDENSAREA